MTRYRATLAYDGTDFQGFQRQREGIPTVQGAVEDALMRIFGQHVSITGAGRTDTGVHATGQVIAFEVNWSHGEQALNRALNANLPDSVAITDLVVAPEGFHPRFDALRRMYRYTLVSATGPRPLLRLQAWVLVGPTLNLGQMAQAAQMVKGHRDFGALGTPPQGESTLRTVFQSQWSTVARGDDLEMVYTIEADAFLYRMVRRTVGMLYDVGRGKLSLAGFQAILESGAVASNVTIAPPQGLVLTRVTYPGDNEAG